ncbi:MAG TPA: ribose-phosphate pyrophosphokinase [Alphaproteobacteria bacterium]|jgi:ribose-phosphate pyrophosphokinase|nr:ribose-phosphate pyrophosphokinase [Alphaproteobacteria bacterium]
MALVFDIAGQPDLAKGLRGGLGAEPGELEMRRFPDGESYLRYRSEVAGRDVVLLCSLDRPNGKIADLVFAAAAARDLCARRVGLVAPYLAYMRQDTRFQSGEAVSSVYFGRMLSHWVDWVVTVDPHLHRHASLDEVLSVPSVVAHAAPALARWIAGEIKAPLLVGPDAESGQWVSSVADLAGAPFVVLEKVRRGDRDVRVSLPHVERWRGHTPVLVDDIVSTGRTMIETVRHLRDEGLAAPVCLAVHGLFAGNAYRELLDAGAARIVTTNAVPHESNAIDISALLADAAARMLA